MPAESINIRQYDTLFEMLDVARQIAYAKSRGVEDLVDIDIILTKLTDLVYKYESLK